MQPFSDACSSPERERERREGKGGTVLARKIMEP
jgi:hypothetical protein